MKLSFLLWIVQGSLSILEVFSKGYRVIQTIVVGAPKTSGAKPGDLYVYEVPVRTDPRDEDANHRFVKIVGEMDEITIKLGKLK